MFLSGKKITNLSLIYISNKQTRINISVLVPVTHTTLRNPYLKVRHYAKSRIFSENSSYDKRCTGLQVWLMEQGYSDKLLKQQVVKARKNKRKDLLNNVKDKENDYKLAFNITYHPKSIS